MRLVVGGIARFVGDRWNRELGSVVPVGTLVRVVRFGRIGVQVERRGLVFGTVSRALVPVVGLCGASVCQRVCERVCHCVPGRQRSALLLRQQAVRRQQRRIKQEVRS